MALRAQRTLDSAKHAEDVRATDLHRWGLVVLTAVLSSALSFAIDQFTWVFGIWRSSLTNDNGSLHLVIAVNVIAVVIARLINRMAIESEGSGFPEMKAMLFGKVMLNFLTLKALVCKALSLSLGVGAGLPLGKEGPNVHMAACISRLLGPSFYETTPGATTAEKHVKRKKVMYLLLAACSTAVGASFAAPIGGVIFALELMLPQIYDTMSYWGCFVSSVAGSLCYTVLRTATSGASTLEPLVSTNVIAGEGATSARPMTRLAVDLLLGALCGLAGGLWVRAHAKVNFYMKKWRAPAPKVTAAGSPQGADSPSRRGSLMNAQIGDGKPAEARSWGTMCGQWKDLAQVVVVVALNTFLAAQLPLLGGKPQPLLISTLFDKNLIADVDTWSLPAVGPLGTMFLCYLMKFSMTILSLTLPISAGMVAPVMIIGGLLGRCYGLMMPDALLDFLLSVPGQTTEITQAQRGALLARFAIVGAAAHATAVSRAFAMAITVYEVLTLPSSVLPLCTSCLAAIFVANKVSLPFFDMNLTGRGLGGISALTHTDHASKSATCIMRHLDAASDCLHERSTVGEIRDILRFSHEDIHEFAILQNVENSQNKVAVDGVASLLKGTISRSALETMVGPSQPQNDEIHLLAKEFTTSKDGVTQPLVCVNPQSVTPDALVSDVYIILKAIDAETVYVIDVNCTLGVISYKELLGHRLDKPWFG
jgi:H+/Cl- antiporter ClcA